MIGIDVVIYLDVLFVINFVFNYIGLLLTKLVACIQVKRWKIIVAATISSVIQLYLTISRTCLIGSRYIVSNLILEIIVIWIVFGKMKIKKYITFICLHTGVVLLMGGLICTIYDKFLAYQKEDISIMEVLLIAILTFVIIKYTLPIILRNIYYKERIYETILSLKGKEIRLKALLDTGNSLTEPTTGKRVTIVEKKTISSFNDLRIDKIYVIPYKSLGKDDGILYGIEVDKLIVKYENYEKINENAIIAIYNGSLSRDGRYNAILHGEILV